MKWLTGGVTAAHGFLASGVSAGIKRGRKLDLALVASEVPATAVGVFTTNAVKAAPVQISQDRLRGGKTRAVLLNSGCANCLTGRQGFADAIRLSRRVASELETAERGILVASTGLIGSRLPADKIERTIPPLVRQLSRARHRQAARAILTTDTVPKEAAVGDKIDGRAFHLGGMAKGVGMMAPHMATMLCVLTTDVIIDRPLLQTLLQGAVESSFNRITVDGDMSTNDSVFLLANGRSGVAVRRGTPPAARFRAMLEQVTQRLALRLVQDGEGATTIVRIAVCGARSVSDAQRCARQVASSLLVKTMLAGRDPNMGRIAAAVGSSGAACDPQRLTIRLEGLGTVVRRGVLVPFDVAAARTWLQARTGSVPTIVVDLRLGRASADMTTCDLTEEYVRINAHYST